MTKLQLAALLWDSATTCVRPEDAASDFRQAYEQACARFDEFSAERRRRTMDEAIREVEGGDDLGRPSRPAERQ